MKRLGCIIVSTPFQMISALSILEQYEEYEFDLYLIENFKGCKELSEAIKGEKLFTNVVMYSLSDIRRFHTNLPNRKERILRTLGRQLSYINYMKIGESISADNRMYEKVFFAAANSALELMMYFQRKYKPQFVLFDDGVMSYRNPEHVLGNNEKFTIIKNIIFEKIGSIKPVKILYRPDLFMKMHPDDAVPMKLNTPSEKMQKIEQNLFSISLEDAIDAEVIVLECIKEEYMLETEAEKLEEIYDMITSSFKDMKILFKRHPRDMTPLKQGRNYLTLDVPFEAINCIQNFNDKILIAWDSTAVLTSKLFYDEEPIVILLYKLVRGKQDNLTETDFLYQNFKECYRNSVKFFIPETMRELMEFVKEV